MCCHQPGAKFMQAAPESFHFLKLPREIRNHVYKYALCTFEGYENPDNIVDYAAISARDTGFASPGHGGARLAGNINLLLVSKQIYEEAFSYMVKTNMFVRIEYRNYYGINMRPFLRNRSGPIPTVQCTIMPEDKSYGLVARFRGYALHLRIGSEGRVQGPQWDVMILGEHFDLFCQSLDIDRAMYATTGPDSDPCLIQAILNPGGWKAPIKSSMPIPLHLERNLLESLGKHMHHFPHLTVTGGTDSNLAQSIMQRAAQLKWNSCEEVLTNLRSFEATKNSAWEMGDYLGTAKACASAVQELECLGQTRLLEDFFKSDRGAHLLDELATLWHGFHLQLARCIRINIYSNLKNRELVQECSPLMHNHIAHYLHLRGELEAYGITISWAQTNEEYAEALCLCAESQRICLGGPWYKDYSYEVTQAVTFMKEALTALPENPSLLEEQQKVLDWERAVKLYDTTYRTTVPLEEQSDLEPFWKWIQSNPGLVTWDTNFLDWS